MDSCNKEKVVPSPSCYEGIADMTIEDTATATTTSAAASASSSSVIVDRTSMISSTGRPNMNGIISNSNNNNNDMKDDVIDLLDTSSSSSEEDNDIIEVTVGPTHQVTKDGKSTSIPLRSGSSKSKGASERRLALRTMGNSMDDAIDLDDDDDDEKTAHLDGKSVRLSIPSLPKPSSSSSSSAQRNHHAPSPLRDETTTQGVIVKEEIITPLVASNTTSSSSSSSLAARPSTGVMVSSLSTGTDRSSSSGVTQCPLSSGVSTSTAVGVVAPSTDCGVATPSSSGMTARSLPGLAKSPSSGVVAASTTSSGVTTCTLSGVAVGSLSGGAVSTSCGVASSTLCGVAVALPASTGLSVSSSSGVVASLPSGMATSKASGVAAHSSSSSGLVSCPVSSFISNGPMVGVPNVGVGPNVAHGSRGEKRDSNTYNEPIYDQQKDRIYNDVDHNNDDALLVKPVHRIPHHSLKSCSGHLSRQNVNRRPPNGQNNSDDDDENDGASDSSSPSRSATFDTSDDTDHVDLSPVTAAADADMKIDGDVSTPTNNKSYKISSDVSSSDGSFFEPAIVRKINFSSEGLPTESESINHRPPSPTVGRSLRPRQKRSRWQLEDPVKVALLRPSYDDRGFKGGRSRGEKKFRYDDDDDEEEHETNAQVMRMVYNRKYLDENSLPVVEFAVHKAESDDIIYEFKVTIKDSLIQGAGKGAFLKFVGALELPPFRKRGAKYLREDRLFRPPNTMEPLVAAHPHGYFVTVKICGENLHTPFNNYQGGLLSSSLIAAVPRPMLGLTQFMKIRFANPEDPYLEKEIEAMQNDGDSNRVGLLGIHSLDDYVRAPDRTFSSYSGPWELIQLALYGPFQPSDRKEFNHYELKTFIFSNEPGEWGFEIDQKRPDGRIQIADITDDKTGMPHSVARANIAMYINETAGDPTLNRTVQPWNHEETGQLFYYFDSAELKRGQEIELLVSYEDHYDDIRERKGYGARIKSGEVLSDDHFPTFLLRNFDERDKVHEVFQELKEPIFLHELLSECTGRYWAHLVQVANSFICELLPHGSTQTLHIPYAQQIVALRRLEWLSTLFVKTYERLQCESHECNANTMPMRWSWWSKLLSWIDGCNQRLDDSRGVDVSVRLRNELIEEHCYALRSRLAYPFGEGAWCDVANELVRSFCVEVTRRREEGDSVLFRCFAMKALEASQAIPHIGLDKLSFSRKAQTHFGVDIVERSGDEESKFIMARLTRQHATIQVLVGIDTVSTQHVDFDWYRSGQILYLVRIFREEFAPNAPEKDLLDLCRRMGVGSEVLNNSLPRYDYVNSVWRRVQSGYTKNIGSQHPVEIKPLHEESSP